MNRLIRSIAFLSLIFVSDIQANESIPNGLSFIGLYNNEWQVVVQQGGQWSILNDVDSPRTMSYHYRSQQLAYIAADGHLRIRDVKSGTNKTIVSFEENGRFTQPHFSSDGQWLYIVELPGGKSRRTNIIGYHFLSKKQNVFVRKRTAQFEPFSDADRYLYYTTAICVDDCEGMIWELWRRDLYSGRQEQLTLMNALARQPHISADGWLYFSSNADQGRFHIWRMRPTVGSKPQQLTSGVVRDSDPVTSLDGRLFFLRKTSQGTQLMQWADGDLQALDTSDFNDLRNLEMGR